MGQRNRRSVDTFSTTLVSWLEDLECQSSSQRQSVRNLILTKVKSSGRKYRYAVTLKTVVLKDTQKKRINGTMLAHCAKKGEFASLFVV